MTVASALDRRRSQRIGGGTGPYESQYEVRRLFLRAAELDRFAVLRAG